jgi:hypothetical protein
MTTIEYRMVTLDVEGTYIPEESGNPAFGGDIENMTVSIGGQDITHILSQPELREIKNMAHREWHR